VWKGTNEGEVKGLPKQSGSGSLDYEKKLARVMERFNVKEKDFNFNYDRQGLAWVEFRYKGELYRFDHSTEKAKARGINLKEGRDAFKQIVLTLEDLARMAERGIYDLQTWVKGMKFLPPVIEVPSFFRVLGFESIPAAVEDVNTRYRTLAKQLHPDGGGNVEDFDKLKKATEEAIRYLNAVRK
jgi:hypothetical protein